MLCFRSLCLPSTGETALETFSRDVEATWDVDTRPHGPRRSNRSPYRQPERRSTTSSSAKAKRIVVGGRGVRAAMYLRSQNCFLMIPRCEPGENHPSHGGGLLRAQEEGCPRITKGRPVGWWAYLIFVNFFTRAKFLESKIYTEKRQFFCDKSVKKKATFSLKICRKCQFFALNL